MYWSSASLGLPRARGIVRATHGEWLIEIGQRVSRFALVNEHGTILSVDPDSFLVNVRWDNGSVGRYYADHLRRLTPLEELAECGEGQ
jgi:hypothetical protein